MTWTDYIAAVLVVVALWGLTTSLPNLNGAKRRLQRLKANGINGYNERGAKKEVRLHRNITRALWYIVALGLSVALPTVRFGGTTIAGLLLTVGLIYGSFALVFWSRAERDDGESAHIELMRITKKRLDEMEAHHGDGS